MAGNPADFFALRFEAGSLPSERWAVGRDDPIRACWGAGGKNQEAGVVFQIKREGKWTTKPHTTDSQGRLRVRWRVGEGKQRELRVARLLLWLRDGPLGPVCFASLRAVLFRFDPFWFGLLC
jgi:hypothetical protein